MGSPSRSSSKAADEGRRPPRLSSGTKCQGGTLRRRRTWSATRGSSGKLRPHSSGAVTSLVRGPPQPRSDQFFVTDQGRFGFLAGLPIFGTPRHRPIGIDFHFDVNSPPVPLDLQPPTYRGDEGWAGNARNHVCRQEFNRLNKGHVRNRLGAVRIPTPRKLQQFDRSIDSTPALLRQLDAMCPNLDLACRPKRPFRWRRFHAYIRQRAREL